MTISLKGKYAIVTGGSRGIGAGIALKFAERGAEGVAITYLGNETAAENTVSKIKAHGALAVAIRANILDAEVGVTIVKAATEGLKTSTIHILVNNAALASMDFNLPIFDTSVELFDQMFHANVRAPIFITRAVFPYLPEQGGRVVNISSIAGKRECFDPVMLYGASKAALNSITRSMGREFAAKKKMTINHVSVGPTSTDAVTDAKGRLPDVYLEAMKSVATAEKRMAETEDIAAIVAFVASDDARWINGNGVPANGGAILLAEG